MKTYQPHPGGWLRLDRAVFSSFCAEKPEHFFRYVDLLSLAAFEETSIYVRRQNITLHRGELVVTTTFLARRWKITHQSASHFLQQLINKGLLARITKCDIIVYIIGSEAIENHLNKQADRNDCTTDCMNGCKGVCNATNSLSADTATQDCTNDCMKVARTTAKTFAQYKNKERKTNKSYINYKPVENDWKRRRGQYTTATCWQDYDESFT